MALLKKKKAAAYAAAVAEKAEMDRALEEYAKFLNSSVVNPDSTVDYVEFGIEAYKKGYEINKRFPNMEGIVDCKFEVSPEDYRYWWLDDECCPRAYSYKEMKDHKGSFDRWLRRAEISDYDLETSVKNDMGEFGPYGACAYLSYARMLKRSMKAQITKIEVFLNKVN